MRFDSTVILALAIVLAIIALTGWLSESTTSFEPSQRFWGQGRALTEEEHKHA